MSKPILLVCKSCSTSQEDIEPSEGTLLLNKLNELNQDRLIVRDVGCLWMCERACVVALCIKEHTYLFTDLPVKESPEALLELADLYLRHPGKSIPYQKFPQVLKSANIARIPSTKDL